MTEREAIKNKFLQRRFAEAADLCTRLIKKDDKNAFAYLVRAVSRFNLNNQYDKNSFKAYDVPETLSDYDKALALNKDILENNPEIVPYVYCPYRKISFKSLPRAEKINEIERYLNNIFSKYDFKSYIFQGIVFISLMLAAFFGALVISHSFALKFLIVAPFVLVWFYMVKIGPSLKWKNRYSNWEALEKDFDCKIEFVPLKEAAPVDWAEDAYTVGAARLYQWKDFKQAQNLCDKAIEKNPEDAAAYYIRSMLNFTDIRSKERMRAALKDFETAIRLDPEIVAKTSGITHRLVFPDAGIAYVFAQPVPGGAIERLNTAEEKLLRKEYLTKYACRTDELRFSDLR